MPDRNTPFANIWLALADPDPFTLANFITKSLVVDILFTNTPSLLDKESFACPMLQ